ncbi:MAG: o-succinylbenzoate synthase [Pyrinomonadaceae bacterium]
MNNLNLEKLELREIEMPLINSFETSFGTATGRRVLLIRVLDKDGVSGWGECTAMNHPFYNHETIDTAWSIITGFIAPMLKEKNVWNAAEVAQILSPIQNNRMAIGGVETAIWDLEAKKVDVPLWQHLGGKRTEINCGVSIGIQKSPEVLLEVVSRELESGYQRIKLKIKPGQDREFVKTIRQNYPDILLSVDANAAYRLHDDVKIFEELDEYDLLMIEQPLAAGDLVDHAKLQKRLKTPICLDESITCLMDAKHALELEACRIINVKLGRVGGHSEAKAIQCYAESKNIPVWCGGMLETGIGRAHNIAMSTLSGFTLPGDVSASARYWEEDIIEPPVEVSPQGTINAPTASGFGYEVKEILIEKLAVRRETFRLNLLEAIDLS